MSTRRGFLGAAAVALSLSPRVGADGSPQASTKEGAPTASMSTEAEISARAAVDTSRGSVSVRSIRYDRGEPPMEAELSVDAFPLSFAFAVDREAARQMHDAIRSPRDVRVGGVAQLFSANEWETSGEVELLVAGARLHVETPAMEASVALEGDTRTELVDGLGDALEQEVTAE